jgi:beta-N-acetylhexosaminidase
MKHAEGVKGVKNRGTKDMQMAGQRLMVGFEGTEMSADLKYMIRELRVGGVILFSGNILEPEQVRHLCISMQTCARECGQPPLFIAVDQEGGVVARFKKPFTEFPGNPFMTGVADADQFAETTARELKDIGINMNMAPVLDVAFDPEQSIMADRSFGADPQWVSLLGGAVIQGLQQSGIMAVAKHFPGIGRTTLDSHRDLPVLDADSAILEKSDLLPFAAAIHQEVAGIMLSHICYRQMDENWPASLSRAIAQDLLRDRLGFGGLVLTDDLDMGAVAKHYDIETAVQRILAADIDIALICHRSSSMENAFKTILAFQEASSANSAHCRRSLERILRAKKRFLGWVHGVTL